MTDNRTPTLGEVVRGHISDALRRLRVAQPGRVESYDADALTVEVTPMLTFPVRQDDGFFEWQALPRISGVPVLFPCAGGRRVKLPVSKGDIVLLVFCDFSLDEWKASTGRQGPIDPLLLDGHAVADAVAIPGLLDPAGGVTLDAIEITADGGITIAPTPGSSVQIGGPTSDIKLGLGTNPVAYLGAQVQAGPFAGVITACPLNLTTKV